MVMKDYTLRNSYDLILDDDYVFQKEEVYPYVVFVALFESLL